MCRKALRTKGLKGYVNLFKVRYIQCKLIIAKAILIILRRYLLNYTTEEWVYIKKFSKGDKVLYKGDAYIYLRKHNLVDNRCLLQYIGESRTRYAITSSLTSMGSITNKDAVSLLKREY